MRDKQADMWTSINLVIILQGRCFCSVVNEVQNQCWLLEHFFILWTSLSLSFSLSVSVCLSVCLSLSLSLSFSLSLSLSLSHTHTQKQQGAEGEGKIYVCVINMQNSLN